MEQKRTIYYEINSSDPSENESGILYSTQEVKERFGQRVGSLARECFEFPETIFNLFLQVGLMTITLTASHNENE